LVSSHILVEVAQTVDRVVILDCGRMVAHAPLEQPTTAAGVQPAVRVRTPKADDLAVAVAIDATIVRVVLVPATMELLGDANGWLPRWLQRFIPRVRVDDDGSDAEPADSKERELIEASG
jgi:ABC-type multidrug transport system ATPase subunit